MAEKINPINVAVQERRAADRLQPSIFDLALEQRHGSSVQESVRKSFISRIPVEVIIITFKMAIDGHDSLVIGTLLLVCRSWNEIVTYTPTLWSRVVLCPQDDRCDFTTLKKYVNTSILNSRNLPLDIYIDFGRRPKKHFIIPPGGENSRSGIRLLHDNSLELALLSHTIGDSGAVMKRWRSFFFKHNDSMVYIKDLFNSFIHPTPFLQHLSLYVRQIFYRSRTISPFPEVPALQTVVLNTAGDLGDILCPPQTLEKLAIRLRKDIATLKPFSNLRILAINCHFRGRDPHGDGKAISLPRLECLTLRSQQRDRLFAQLFQRIEVLSLKTLRLLGAAAVFIGLRTASFYKVEDLHLLMEEDASHYLCAELKTLLHDEGTSVNEIMSSSSLQTHISNYSALHNVTVTPWHLGAAIKRCELSRPKAKLLPLFILSPRWSET